MTVDAELWNGRILLGAPLHYKDAIAAIPGSRYENGRWTVPTSWASCLRLRAVFGGELKVWPELAAWATDMKLNVIDPAFNIRDAITGDGDARLYEFQRPGVTWIKTAQRCLLGDEVGSGKTIQLIMSDRPKPVLVVAPKSMLFKWQREWELWEPGFDVRVASGTAAQRRVAIENGDVVIMTWESLAKHSRLAPFGGINLSDKETIPSDLNHRQWKTVVLDEAHKAKSPRAKQTRAAWAICHGDSVESVVAMTGTPIANQLDELWAIMHAVNPDAYPSKSKWVERYAEKGFNMYGGLTVSGVKPAMREEFFAILDPQFRRMPKAVTLPQLPPIRGGLSDPNGLDVRLVEMELKQAKAYKEMRDTMVAELESGVAVTTRPITKVLRMMQFASAYAEVTDYVDDEGHHQQNFKLTEPSCKVDAVVDILEEFQGEPVVFFAASRQLIDLCALRLTKLKIPHGLVVGGQSAFERQQTIDSFQAGLLPALLCVVKAGSTGITLTRSRIEVVLQRDDSLIENIQMEGRVHRIGSEIHENVRIIDVVTKDTIEPRVVERLYAKDDHLQEICRDKDTLARLLKGA